MARCVTVYELMICSQQSDWMVWEIGYDRNIGIKTFSKRYTDTTLHMNEGYEDIYILSECSSKR